MQIDVRVCKTQAHPGQVDGPCTRVDIEFPSEHEQSLVQVLGPELGFHLNACDETQLIIAPGGTNHLHPYQEGAWLRGVLRMEQGHPYLELVGAAFTKTCMDRGAKLHFGPAYIVVDLPSPGRRVAPRQQVQREGSTREGSVNSWTPSSGEPRPPLGELDLRNPLHYAERVRQVGVDTAREEQRALMGWPVDQRRAVGITEADELIAMEIGEQPLGDIAPMQQPTIAERLQDVIAELPRENQATIGEWLRSTPMWEHATDLAMVTRTLKELSELLTLFSHRPRDPTSPEADVWFDKVVDETADVFITLYNLPNIMGFDLHKAIDAKMRVNRARKWARTVAGDHHHVEGT